jgi:hypothetical protein
MKRRRKENNIYYTVQSVNVKYVRENVDENKGNQN